LVLLNVVCFSVDTTLKVTRALEILGASMLLVAMGAFLLKLLVMKTQGPLHILAAIFAALAGESVENFVHW